MPAGAVINLWRGIAIYGNQSTTFNLNIGAQDAYGKLIPSTASLGKDAGIRMTMPNGKLAASLGWYSAYQKGQTFLTGLGFKGAIDDISGAPVIGDLSSSGRNARGVQRFPTNVNTTQTSDTTGYEFEMTANPHISYVRDSYLRWALRSAMRAISKTALFLRENNICSE